MSKIVRRFDKGSVTSAKRTPQGYLRAPVVATRVGVFNYRMPDGSTLRELRHPEEVFKPDSLETLAGVPWTDEHPEVALLTHENTREYQRGYTGDQISHDDTNVMASGTITDSELISKIEMGKREVSCGYTCELDMAPGIWNGIPYDCVQRNITYNHIASVDQGRAGPTVRIQMDAADAFQGDALEKTTQKEPEMTLKKITLGGKTFEVNADHADAMEAAHNDAMSAEAAKTTAAEAKAAEATKASDTVQAKHDALEADLAKAKAAHKDAADINVPALVKERMRLEKAARIVLDSEAAAKIEAMSDMDIKKAVIVADSKDAKLDDKSDAYVSARFDSIQEKLDSDDAEAERIASALKSGQKRTDGSEMVTDSSQAREAAMQKSRDLWKQPLSATASNK